MRTSQEVRDELEDILKTHAIYKTTDSTEDIIQGWAEALEWVLSDYQEGE